VRAGTLGCGGLSLGRARPAQPGAGAREEGQDFAMAGFWVGGSGSGRRAWIWERLRRPSFCLIT